MTSRELIELILEHQPDLDGYTPTEAFEGGVYAAFRVLLARGYLDRTKVDEDE